VNPTVKFVFLLASYRNSSDPKVLLSEEINENDLEEGNNKRYQRLVANTYRIFSGRMYNSHYSETVFRCPLRDYINDNIPQVTRSHNIQSWLQAIPVFRRIQVIPNRILCVFSEKQR